MASKFQNRLVGTIVLVALGVIILPGLLDGQKKHYQDGSNPQMEGFFFMAQQYKEKIAAGGELTAQQIANMNHIVVNNYTNAGLSILFLVVVYSIIFYGIKTWLNVRNNKVRTDKETPYVPVPEGGVKTSSHH